jgi:hypothetical protein
MDFSGCKAQEREADHSSQSIIEFKNAWDIAPRILNLGFSPGIKWPGREADHNHPSTAEVKNAWS